MNVNAYDKLGNYRLVRQLGVGGFSTVYLGEHLHHKTPAAVKVLHSHLFSDEALTSFLEEIRLVEQLNHPHIVRVLESGVEEHTPYLVFQYAPNGTVRQRYPKGSRIPLPIIVLYVKQIAEALQYAHERKIIHRDIKPENFLLGKDNEILLGDFGLAIPSRSSAGVLDRERAGTAEYMAPEQSLGKSSRASDQYALGIVVYEWICGYPPFRGDDYKVLHQHIHDAPTPLHELVPTIPTAIEQVVMRALAKKPSRRFPQIQDFAQALEAAYRQSLAQQIDAAIAPAAPLLSPALGSSLSEQKVVDVDQPQPQPADAAALPAARHDNPDGVQQQVGQGANPPLLPVSSDERATDPAMPTQKLAAIIHPAQQERRMSRRSVVAAGILGFAALGAGAVAWYLHDSSASTPAHHARTASGGTIARLPAGGTSNAGGTGPGGTSSPLPTPGATTAAPTAPLVLQIGNAGALAQVRVNSTNNVLVMTSQPGIPAIVRVAYSDGTVQTLGPQTTDGNGNATLTWRAHPKTGLGKLRGLLANLVASATDANGQTISSAPITTIILL